MWVRPFEQSESVPPTVPIRTRKITGRYAKPCDGETLQVIEKKGAMERSEQLWNG
jgi:hypothetical protein